MSGKGGVQPGQTGHRRRSGEGGDACRINNLWGKAACGRVCGGCSGSGCCQPSCCMLPVASCSATPAAGALRIHNFPSDGRPGHSPSSPGCPCGGSKLWHTQQCRAPKGACRWGRCSGRSAGWQEETRGCAHGAPAHGRCCAAARCIAPRGLRLVQQEANLRYNCTGRPSPLVQ